MRSALFTQRFQVFINFSRSEEAPACQYLILPFLALTPLDCHSDELLGTPIHSRALERPPFLSQIPVIPSQTDVAFRPNLSNVPDDAIFFDSKFSFFEYYISYGYLCGIEALPYLVRTSLSLFRIVPTEKEALGVHVPFAKSFCSSFSDVSLMMDCFCSISEDKSAVLLVSSSSALRSLSISIRAFFNSAFSFSCCKLLLLELLSLFCPTLTLVL
eukprot:TRINITY_DN4359_c0_g1_i1.p1 TRINITY_DN4359_c0_g1~~TRINITY_DN4359_c0_g1_i1.p1  ORF type:complete len:215 (+),score=21.70 TRINITY_DN4359_c0_g1_i1:358-1002(+)